MKREHPASQVIRFGVFEVDLQSRELHKQGLKVRNTPINTNKILALGLLLQQESNRQGAIQVKSNPWLVESTHRAGRNPWTKPELLIPDRPDAPRYSHLCDRLATRNNLTIGYVLNMIYNMKTITITIDDPTFRRLDDLVYALELPG